MLSVSALTAGQAESYFDHEKDYYTEHQSNYDRWHGSLAESRGFVGEVNKEQFDAYLDYIAAQGRERAGIDCTFSAPKSVSLALAADEQTRADMIRAQQAAMDVVSNEVEQSFIETRIKSGGHLHQHLLTRNMSAAEFMHFTARPSERAGFVPDLDIHSHLVILDDTYADGDSRHVDARKIMNRERLKALGLTYRAALAANLQKMGYELEITDAKQGFWELKGFNRATIEANSSRAADVRETQTEHGITDAKKANLYSRRMKSEATASFSEVLAQKHAELFESGAVTISRKEAAC